MNLNRKLQNVAIPGHPLLTLARWISWSIHCILRISANVSFASIPQKMYLLPRIRHFGSTSIFIKRDLYEPELLVCKTFVSPGSLVVDVGGSFGVYTLFLANYVGATGKVITFEPGTLSFSILERNVRESGLGNIQIHKIALCDVNDVKELYHIEESPVNFSLGGGTGIAGEQVQAARLDDLSLDTGTRELTFMKVDVEGCEALVFDGALETISRSKPVIMFEVAKSATARAGLAETATFAFLNKLDYRFFTWNDGLVPVNPPVEGNVFAIPAERLKNYPELPYNVHSR